MGASVRLSGEVMQQEVKSGWEFRFVIGALAFVHVCAFVYWLFLLWRSRRDAASKMTANRRSYDRLEGGKFEMKIPHRFLKIPGIGRKKYTH